MRSLDNSDAHVNMFSFTHTCLNLHLRAYVPTCTIHHAHADASMHHAPTQVRNTLFVENYDGAVNVEIKGHAKLVVYLLNCKNSSFCVKDKVKTLLVRTRVWDCVNACACLGVGASLSV